ncbi:hypothetical protein PtB15_11B286 [Puccinia triticina]|nr:hypothetical protein PtB15_11B286 [Puccinia triticina]
MAIEGDGELLVYANAFKSLHPRQAHNTLLNRLRQARNINEELLEQLRERITIEEHYSRTLTKLSRKTQPANNPSPESGRFRYDQEQQQADGPEQDSHQLSFEDHQTQLRTTDEQLARLIQALQSRQTEDQQIFNQAKQLWTEQSTQAFKTYQAVDQQRLLELFETLTKFETIQSDYHRQQMEISEKSTMSLLAFDLKEDIHRFALINGNNSIIHDPPNNPTPAPGHSRHPTAETHSRQPTIELHSRQPTLELHSRQPTLELHSRQPTLELHSRQPSPGRASEANDTDQEQLRQSARSPSLRPSAFTTPTVPPAASSSSSSSAQPTYDPNHPEIPKLNAPNISVPIRSTPTSPALNAQNGLPPRTLYVQRRPSSESLSVANRSRPSGDLARSQRSNMRTTPTSKPAASGPSIAEKLFSRTRLTNMLSRNTSNNNSANGGTPASLKQPQARRMSQTNLPASRLNESTSSPTPTDRSRQRRSSSMMGRDTSTGPISPPTTTTPPETAAALQKPGWSSSRLGHFLPGSGPLLKKKFSQSSRHWTAKDQPASAKASAKTSAPRVDSEGFSIPPVHRDRPPWETDTDTEVLSLDRTEGSSHHHPNNSSRTNVQEQPDVPDRAGNTTPGAAGKHQFAIKPSASQDFTQPLDEAARLAAIQRVQNTLASSSTGPIPGLVGGTRRSNAALRGRRADGRGVTMYDASPVPAVPAATSLVRRGTVSERPDPATTEPLEILPTSPASFERSGSDQTGHTPRTAPTSFSHLYSSPETLSSSLGNPPSATFPHPQLNNQSPGSRSNSLSSAVSLAGPSSSKNPFLSMSLSSVLSPAGSARQLEDTPGVVVTSGPALSDGTLLSVSEKLNVLMHQGVVTKLLIIGQVCIPASALRGVLSPESTKDGFSFRIAGLDRLEKVVYPRDLVGPTTQEPAVDGAAAGTTGEYRLDLARLQALFPSDSSQTVSEDVCLLKYRVFLDHASPSLVRDLAPQHVPLIVVPRWRCLPDKTELVITYRPSPAFRTLHHAAHVRLCHTKIETTVFAGDHPVRKPVASVQSLPHAQFDPKNNHVAWSIPQPPTDDTEELTMDGGVGTQDRERLGVVGLDKVDGKLICRFIHPSPSPSSSSSSSSSSDDDEEGETGETSATTTSPAEEKKEKKKKQKDDHGKGALEESCGPVSVTCDVPDIALSGTTVSFGSTHLPHQPVSAAGRDPRIRVRSVCSTFLAR